MENPPEQPATMPLSLSLIDSQTPALGRATGPAQSAAGSRNWLRRPWLGYALLPLLAGAALAIPSNSLHVDRPAFSPTDQAAAATSQTTAAERAVSSPPVAAPREMTRIPIARPAVLAIDRKSSQSAASRVKPSKEGAAAGRPIDESPLPTLQKTDAPVLRGSRGHSASAEGLELNRGASTHGARAATLVLAIKPWGEVYVDGTKIGVTPPLKRLELTPGIRRVTVTNSFLPRYEARLSVQPGARVRVAHDFECISNREKACRDGFGKGLELKLAAPEVSSR